MNGVSPCFIRGKHDSQVCVSQGCETQTCELKKNDYICRKKTPSHGQTFHFRRSC